MNFEQALEQANLAMEEYSKKHSPIAEKNLAKVLDAMRELKISDSHLKGSTGYGYGDVGRDTLEEVFAKVFKAEEVLMRQQIVSGTHAISLALMSNLLPNDELLYVGEPYDTLQTTIGLNGHVPGSLMELGVTYREIDFDFDAPDANLIVNSISEKTKILAFQRSRGYNWRPAFKLDVLEKMIAAVKAKFPNVIIFVDNCYGEFVYDVEPIELGADMIAGSMIKNMGGGLAPCGGYIAGRADLIERAAARLTAPGIGKEVGPSLEPQKIFYQGLFYAPMVVHEALCSAEYTAALMDALGFEVSPKVGETRSDIVEAIKFGREDMLLAFIRGIQKYSPIDSYVRPDPWDMPGYSSQVIMASGAFIAGSSIELSADAPVIEPYITYFQGGISRFHGKIAVANTMKDMKEAGLF